jgi:hypothetical protein
MNSIKSVWISVISDRVNVRGGGLTCATWRPLCGGGDRIGPHAEIKASAPSVASCRVLGEIRITIKIRIRKGIAVGSA